MDEEPSINLTPLIDVVFVILIMFIVVAPLLELDQVTLAPGKEGAASTVRDASPVAVHVRRDGSLLAGGKPIHRENLEGWLQQMHASLPSAVPQLFCDKEAPFGAYQGVKNAAESAGYEELEVVLEPA